MKNNTWLIVALVISMGTNLLVAGVAIGRMVHGPSPMLEWMTGDVSDETRSKILNSMKKHFRDTWETRRQMRDLQARLGEAVVAEEYDEAKVTTLFAELRQVSARLQQRSHRQIIENLREMTPEERRHAFPIFMHREMRKRGGPPRRI